MADIITMHTGTEATSWPFYRPCLVNFDPKTIFPGTVTPHTTCTLCWYWIGWVFVFSQICIVSGKSMRIEIKPKSIYKYTKYATMWYNYLCIIVLSLIYLAHWLRCFFKYGTRCYNIFKDRQIYPCTYNFAEGFSFLRTLLLRKAFFF